MRPSGRKKPSLYPFLRLPWQLWRHRRDPPLAILEEHVSRHVCWPWDLDFWGELNNGRTLTLYDLGRVPWSGRIGLIRALRREGWAVTVAGASVRYRRRVRAFDRLVMRTRAVGWDARFVYVEQAMWLRSGPHRGECASHVLLRAATTDRRGLIPPADVLAAMGIEAAPPELPAFARAWVEAEATRPWPPMGP